MQRLWRALCIRFWPIAEKPAAPGTAAYRSDPVTPQAPSSIPVRRPAGRGAGPAGRQPRPRSPAGAVGSPRRRNHRASEGVDPGVEFQQYEEHKQYQWYIADAMEAVWQHMDEEAAAARISTARLRPSPAGDSRAAPRKRSLAPRHRGRQNLRGGAALAFSWEAAAARISTARANAAVGAPTRRGQTPWSHQHGASGTTDPPCDSVAARGRAPSRLSGFQSHHVTKTPWSRHGRYAGTS
jgi:hypothetical protein